MSVQTESRRFAFSHRQRPLELVVTEDGTLELYLDGVLRKDRPAGEQDCQYVWTNVELQWEEHHYVEARYWAAQRRLVVTVNRLPAYDVAL